MQGVKEIKVKAILWFYKYGSSHHGSCVDGLSDLMFLKK